MITRMRRERSLEVMPETAISEARNVPIVRKCGRASRNSLASMAPQHKPLRHDSPCRSPCARKIAVHKIEEGRTASARALVDRPSISIQQRRTVRGYADYFATDETTAASAPSFIGVCATSLRHAPRATAAITVARTIAPFIVFSPMLSLALPNFDQRTTLRPQPLTNLFRLFGYCHVLGYRRSRLRSRTAVDR